MTSLTQGAESRFSSSASRDDQQVSLQDPGGILLSWVNKSIPGDPSAREAIFAWLMALPANENPANAAARIQADYDLDRLPANDQPISELAELLDQIRLFNGQQLSRPRRRTNKREAKLLN